MNVPLIMGHIKSIKGGPGTQGLMGKFTIKNSEKSPPLDPPPVYSYQSAVTRFLDMPQISLF